MPEPCVHPVPSCSLSFVGGFEALLLFGHVFVHRHLCVSCSCHGVLCSELIGLLYDSTHVRCGLVCVGDVHKIRVSSSVQPKHAAGQIMRLAPVPRGGCLVHGAGPSLVTCMGQGLSRSGFLCWASRNRCCALAPLSGCLGAGVLQCSASVVIVRSSIGAQPSELG